MTSSATSDARRTLLGVALAAVLLAGIVIASLMPVVVFVWQQFETANDAVRPVAATPLLSLAQAGLMAVLCLLLRLAKSWRRIRAISTLWLAGALILMMSAPVQLFAAGQDVSAYATVGFTSLLVVVLLRFLASKRGLLAPLSRTAALWVLPFVVVAWLPWLVRGALGSVLDSILAGIVSMSLGLWLVTLDELVLAPAFDGPSDASGVATLLRGVALGVLTMLLCKSFGFNGHVLLLLAAVPAAGIAFARLAGHGPNGRSGAGLLAAGIAFGPLAFVDSKEFNIVLGGDDIPGVMPLTALLAFVLSVALSIVLSRWRRSMTSQNKVMTVGMAAGALAAAAAAYIVLGQPGLYADRIFVIMKQKADLESIASIPVPATRAEATYKVLTTFATANQFELRSQLTQFGFRTKPYYLVNAIEIESPLDGGALLSRWLMTRSDVDRVLASPHHHPLSRALGGVPAPQFTSPGDVSTGRPSVVPWGIKQTGADRVWTWFETRGAGIVVGNGDSGIDGVHENLRDAYRGSTDATIKGDQYNWFDPWGGQPSPVDYGEHGTHTMGTVLGKTTGVAPDAKWIGCVNLARNLGNPAVYLDCMQFMLAPHPQLGDPFTQGRPDLGANVVNNSWGCPDLEGCDPNVYIDAVHALRTAGIFMAVSAGNSGPACSSVTAAPAIYGDVFTVGAYDARGDIADFSSRGPVTSDGSGRIKPDVIAPGVEVISSVPHNKYMANSGTSMAGPHVAGIVALMWSANPKLIGNIDRTEAILRQSVSPYRGAAAIGCAESGAPAQPRNVIGYGMVDAFAAVKQAVAER